MRVVRGVAADDAAGGWAPTAAGAVLRCPLALLFCCSCCCCAAADMDLSAHRQQPLFC